MKQLKKIWKADSGGFFEIWLKCFTRTTLRIDLIVAN